MPAAPPSYRPLKGPRSGLSGGVESLTGRNSASSHNAALRAVRGHTTAASQVTSPPVGGSTAGADHSLAFSVSNDLDDDVVEKRPALTERTYARSIEAPGQTSANASKTPSGRPQRVTFLGHATATTTFKNELAGDITILYHEANDILQITAANGACVAQIKDARHHVQCFYVHRAVMKESRGKKFTAYINYDASGNAGASVSLVGAKEDQESDVTKFLTWALTLAKLDGSTSALTRIRAICTEFDRISFSGASAPLTITHTALFQVASQSALTKLQNPEHPRRVPQKPVQQPAAAGPQKRQAAQPRVVTHTAAEVAEKLSMNKRNLPPLESALGSSFQSGLRRDVRLPISLSQVGSKTRTTVQPPSTFAPQHKPSQQLHRRLQSSAPRRDAWHNINGSGRELHLSISSVIMFTYPNPFVYGAVILGKSSMDEAVDVALRYEDELVAKRTALGDATVNASSDHDSDVEIVEAPPVMARSHLRSAAVSSHATIATAHSTDSAVSRAGHRAAGGDTDGYGSFGGAPTSSNTASAAAATSNPNLSPTLPPPPPLSLRHAGSVEFKVNDLAHLCDGNLLNDCDIDWWMTFMLLRRTVSDEHRDRFYIASSFFYRTLALNKRTVREKHESPQFAGWRNVSRWTKGVNIFDRDFFLAPINNVEHWSLLAAANLRQVAALLDLKDAELRSKHGRAPRPTASGLGATEFASSNAVRNDVARDSSSPPGGNTDDDPSSTQENSDVGQHDGSVSDSPVVITPLNNATCTSMLPRKIPVLAVDQSNSGDDNDGDASYELQHPASAVAPPDNAVPVVTNTRPGTCDDLDMLLLPTESQHHDVNEQRLASAKQRVKNADIVNWKPVLLFMDSLKCHNKKAVCDEFRTYLQHEWEMRINGGQRVGGASRAEPGEFFLTSADMPAVAPRVTEQLNACDCGVFTLKYAERLFDLSRPELDSTAAGPLACGVPTAASNHELRGIIAESDFTVADVAQLRTTMYKTALEFADHHDNLAWNSVPRNVVAERASAGRHKYAADSAAQWISWDCEIPTGNARCKSVTGPPHRAVKRNRGDSADVVVSSEEEDGPARRRKTLAAAAERRKQHGSTTTAPRQESPTASEKWQFFVKLDEEDKMHACSVPTLTDNRRRRGAFGEKTVRSQRQSAPAALSSATSDDVDDSEEAVML